MSASRSLRYLTFLVLIFAGATATSAQSDRDTGIEHYRSGNYKEAVSILGKLVDERTADRPTVLYLAASYFKLGRTHDAAMAFKRLSKAKRPKVEMNYDTRYKILTKPGAACRFERGSHAYAKVAVELRPEGRLGFVTVFDSSGGQFALNAAEAASRITFEPAVVSGSPVAAVVEVEYRCSIV